MCNKKKRDNEVSQLGAIVQTVAALQLTECRNYRNNKQHHDIHDTIAAMSCRSVNIMYIIYLCNKI